MAGKPEYLSVRRNLFRRPLKWFARIMLWLLTRSSISGTEHFPTRGPYIVAGNHRGIMEVALMMMACPHDVEVIGAGDIPLDRRYRYFAKWYGYIPYSRGQLDRKALRRAQHILESGGVVGIFPEGGIWQAARKSAHNGVSWLSFSTGAPVVPVGFGGVAEAIHKAFFLQNPLLEANVGEPIPVERRDHNLSRKQQMEHFAEIVLDHIEDLIPQWDRDLHSSPEWEEFELHLSMRSSSGEEARVEDQLYRPDVLARFFHLPVLINALYYNLKRRRVRPLRKMNTYLRADKLGRAVSVVLGYVRMTNPAFFSYRLGSEMAHELERSLISLRNLTRRAALERRRIRITPIKRTKMPGSNLVKELRRPVFSRRL
ncbi:MAG: lysophospholipid acyltransferase family protein [Spirochaetaceae bacterium]